MKFEEITVTSQFKNPSSPIINITAYIQLIIGSMTHFRDLKISTVIWANHNFRACIDVMRKTSKKIFEDESMTIQNQDLVFYREDIGN